METHQLSQAAYDRLQAELDDLTTRGRIEVADKIERARVLGDLRERRLPRGQGRAGPHGGPHPPARVPPRERRDHRGAASRGVVGPGTIVTIVYEGDADDEAERYLVGHIEEQTGGLDVMSPTVAARRRAASAPDAGDSVAYEAPNGASCRSRSSQVETA